MREIKIEKCSAILLFTEKTDKFKIDNLFIGY